MFTSLYFYRVPLEKAETFLAIQRRAAGIYRRHGALDDWTFAAGDLSARYGCAALSESVPTGPGEALFFSLSLFQSQAEHDRIMKELDSNAEIEALYGEICEVLDMSKVIRGEFNRVV